MASHMSGMIFELLSMDEQAPRFVLHANGCALQSESLKMPTQMVVSGPLRPSSKRRLI